jgi:hypothetical protein
MPFFPRKPKVPPLITGQALRMIIGEAWPGAVVFMSDGDATSYAQIDAADAWRWHQQAEPHCYAVPLWDCDDIALTTLINARRWGRDRAGYPPAFGVAYRPPAPQKPGHYFCFFIDLAGELRVLSDEGTSLRATAQGHPSHCFL